jgi:catecholate siderophore receptor
LRDIKSGHVKVASLATPKSLRRRSLPGEIENIFNKGYWASADGTNNLSPGRPRTFRLKVTAKL